MPHAAGVPVREGLFTESGLVGGHCPGCDRPHFPQAATCPWCGSTGIAPTQLSGEATLWAWTAVNSAPPGFDGEVPYGFGVVELVGDGLRVVTRLTEPDPARLREGMPMRFTVVAIGSGALSWAFEPV